MPTRSGISELAAGRGWLFSEIYTDRELARRRRRYMAIVKSKTAPEELAAVQ